MDNLDVLTRDFGLGGRGKSNPMRSDSGDQRSSSVHSTSPFFDDHNNQDSVLFSDMFGVPPKYSSTSAINHNSASVNDFDYDSIFKTSSAAKESISSKENTVRTSSFPVYDKPVYDDDDNDDDAFDGLPGQRSTSTSTGRVDDDVFVSMTLPSEQRKNSTADHFDDLLGKLAKNDRSDIKNLNSEGFDGLLGNFKTNESVVDRRSSSTSARGLDDLLGGFGGGSSVGANRSASDSNHGQKPSGITSQSTARMMDDPFVVLERTSPPVSSSGAVFTDPLEEIGRLGKSRNGETDTSFGRGGVFDDLDPLISLRRSAATSVPSNGGNDISPSRPGPGISGPQTLANSEHVGKPSFNKSNSHSQKKMPDDNFQESPIIDIPATDYRRSFHTNPSSPPHVNANNNETNFPGGMPPRSEEHLHPSDDVWLSVSEIPLFTQPTRTAPPSRPPPPIPRRNTEPEPGFSPSDLRKRGDDFASPPAYTPYLQIPKFGRPAANSTSVTQIDELEDFAMGITKNTVDEDKNPLWEEMNANSIAADAMKEAMDRAEAKVKHAKEVREREYAKAAKTKEAVHVDQDDDAFQEAQEREFHENQDRLERERRQREEEGEREQRRLERERERAREIEREKGRQAVERATREARERAGTEARLKAERAAVGKVQNEARERAERAAVLRAQTEARERAAAEARERQEKAAAEAREREATEAREKEAREKAAVEARRRAERAAVERAAAEARQRAAAQAQEKAAAAARVNQQKNDYDMESIFKTDSRANSAPRFRGNPSDSIFDAPPSRGSGGSQGPKPTHAGSPSNMPKAFSTGDDLASIFGVDAQYGQFQAVEGENEERTKAIWERNKRTQERAAKALAEKNQRDLQAQREQEERHRISESLDIEIKRWSAGKEGNIRALLSTLQYVLWPECGWQPVSLTDLIIGSNVKKVYRKATLCIHPDKVQQKGATIQQKYISEKVFDLLKEAWNKFNSEELF